MCGVEARDIAGGAAAYGPAIDMFSPEADEDEADDGAANLRAAFPHAASRDLRGNRDPMLLLNRHMQQQRRERGSAASGRGGREARSYFEGTMRSGPWPTPGASRPPRGLQAPRGSGGRGGGRLRPSWPY